MEWEDEGLWPLKISSMFTLPPPPPNNTTEGLIIRTHAYQCFFGNNSLHIGPFHEHNIFEIEQLFERDFMQNLHS